MTKKKRELIEILLDNITPDDWPEDAKWAAQEDSGNVYGYEQKPKMVWGVWNDEKRTHTMIFESETGELCKHWSKTIVTSDEFVKRWNERSIGETNATTPPATRESHTEETKPIQQEVKATDTQVGGNHYTKLAIQPMRYSMENGLDALQHTVIKYVTRFRDKAGIEDLEKAKHCIDMLIEFERNKS